ncbi:hypothetical protein BDR06DRAFT_1051169 [Suillus hirtellus]|nr:hypothetical protein BDR06DRAFT_1051169 [Suillus hirtellus]
MDSSFMLIRDEKVHEPETDSYYSADDVAAAKSLQLVAILSRYAASTHPGFTNYSHPLLYFLIQIYDNACSFHDELTFLLQSRWTKVKGLYVIARYLPFLVLVTYQYRVGLNPNDPNNCRMVINIIYFFLFLLRTYALWNNNGIVLAAMLSAFFVVAVASIIVDVVTVEVSHVAINTIQGIRSCYETSSGVQVGTMFVLLFGFQLGIAFLTIIRAIQRWRAVNCPLYDVLVKHNIFYYTCGLPLSIISVLTQMLLPKTAYPLVCKVFEFYFLAILATRMHLFLWQTDQQTRGSDTLVHIPMSDVLPADSMVTTV